MKAAMLVLLVLSVILNDPLRTTKINRAKRDAREAFQQGDYTKAVGLYRHLIDSMGINEEELSLNLAHALYLSKDTANAFPVYRNLAASADRKISSVANQQLGVMANAQKKPQEALDYFKRAIRSDPGNEAARYNYEMLKKKLDNDNKKDDQKKKDQDKNDQQKKDQEPSEFAKQLKARADKLVADRQYQAAFDLMMNGLKQDETVSHYQDYINRIKDVAEINK